MTDNRGPEFLAASGTLVPIAFITTALRVYVRSCITKSFGFDDGCMVIALLGFLGLCISSMMGVTYGAGRHHADLSDENIRAALLQWFLSYLWVCFAMGFARISIILFFLRLTIKPLHIRILRVLMVIVILVAVVAFLILLFQCSPIHYFWDKRGEGSCLAESAIIGLIYLYSVSSVLIDFMLAIAPIALIYQLQMSRRIKWTLIPLMLVGCMGGTAVIIRWPYLGQLEHQDDFLYATLDVAIWSVVEPGIAITAGSVATLYPLVKPISRLLGLSTSDTDAQQQLGEGPHAPNELQLRARSAPARKGGFSISQLLRTNPEDGLTINDPEPGQEGRSPEPPKHAVGWKGMSSIRDTDSASQQELTRPETEHDRRPSWDQQEVTKPPGIIVTENRL